MKSNLDTLAARTLRDLVANYELTAALMGLDASDGDVYGAFCVASLVTNNDITTLLGIVGLLVRREVMARQGSKRQMALSE